MKVRPLLARPLVADPAAAADNADPNLATVKNILHEVPLLDGHNDVPWHYSARARLKKSTAKTPRRRRRS